MITRLNNQQNIQYKSIFFDLDGTLLESGEGIFNALNYMFGRLGMQEDDEKRLRAFIGPPIKHHLKDAYAMDEQQTTKAYSFFKEYYIDKGEYESRLYPGVQEMIKTVYKSGIRLFIATSKREHMIYPALEKYQLFDYFEATFGGQHDKGIYDKTQVLQNAVERLGGLPASTIMIGDRHYDIIGGKAIGVDTAGVLYGYGSRQELVDAGCDYLLDTVGDISNLAGVLDQ